MAAKRKRRRKGRHGFLFAVFAVIGGCLLFVLMSGMFFKITAVRVEGVSVYREADIVEKSGFSIGENIFLINKVTAIRTIRASFPYADSVKVRRELPGTVIIVVVEKAPVVKIEEGGYYWYMDAEGVLLESVSVPLAKTSLPVVKGFRLQTPVAGTQAEPAEGDLDKLPVLLMLLEVLLEKDMWRDTQWIDLTQISNPTFRYLERFTARLGTPEHLSRKLDFLLGTVEQCEESAKGTVDLSGAYDNNYAYFYPE